MIRIGTRRSRLALAQAELVRQKIAQAFPDEPVELVPIITQGDRRQNQTLASFGGKGVFIQELEEQLLNGSIDLAVHSAKDLPVQFAKGLCLGAVIGREDARDVVVSRTDVHPACPPATGIVGTGSLRRELQIKRLHPSVKVQPIRGNVPTRLQKLRDGQYDALILAAAGLQRLGLDHEEDLKYAYMNPEEFVPAAGQGILAVEAREGACGHILSVINDETARRMLEAERVFQSAVGGSCNAPCGVCCMPVEDGYVLHGMYAQEGQQPVYSSLHVARQEEKQLSAWAEGLAWQLRAAFGETVRKHFVSIVGAGPGSRDYISRKGLQCVRTADVILYDNLIAPSLLNEAGMDAELLYTGKRADRHSMKQEEINALLIEKAQEGRYVVRLKGGDPFVFGRGGEEALACKEHGISYEIVPGISSAYSVPACAGIPVTHRGTAAAFHVVTGHEGAGKKESEVDYHTLAHERGTLVFLMGLQRLGEITSALMAEGRPRDTPAAVIQSGATARMRMAAGCLGDITERVREAGLRTPAVIVIGETAALAGQLQWQPCLPLTGTRVLLTGTRQMNGRLERELEVLGAETVSISLVETRPICNRSVEGRLAEIGQYQWLVFASAAGVHAFFELLNELRIDRRSLMQIRFATVGASTADVLAEYGYYCDFQPSGSYQSKALAEEWIPTLQASDHVLLIRAKEGSAYLEEMLGEAGIWADAACIYETVQDLRRTQELQRVIKQVDYIVAASGSAARTMRDMLGLIPDHAEESEKEGRVSAGAEETEDGVVSGVPGRVSVDTAETEDGVVSGIPGNGKLVSIGPMTSAVCRELGMPPDLEAAVYSAKGIADVIMADVAHRI